MFKLKFIGTRGEIDPRSKRHHMHTSLLLTYQRKKIMIDCGRNWIKKVHTLKPHHILLTHAHPDHAWGLKNGAPCPVWGAKDTIRLIQNFPLEKVHVLPLRRRKKIEGISFEPFPVWHSIRCPAVGYRIICDGVKFFYVPDVTWISQIHQAMQGISFYIGDGATIVHPMTRRHLESGQIIGHATVRQQLTWCKKYKVPEMIITHCGSAIVSNEKRALKHIEKLAEERGVAVTLAYDGYEIRI